MKDSISKYEAKLLERHWQVVNLYGHHVGSPHATLDSAIYFMEKVLKKDIRKGCKIVIFETFVMDAII